MTSADNKLVFQINSLQDLLALNDEAFIRAAYFVLLARSPDNQGLKFYLHLIREGACKEEILAKLSYSDEGRQRKINLPGLKKAIRRYHWQQLPVVGPLFRVRSNEKDKRLRVIENQLYMLNGEGCRVESMLLRIQDRQPIELVGEEEGFDADWYLGFYVDVREEGADPLEHYRIHGQADGRFRNRAEMLQARVRKFGNPDFGPADDFDADWYLEFYPDVKAEGIDALEHYNRYGKVYGRFRNQAEMLASRGSKAHAAAAEEYVFDPEWYLEYYQDVRAEGVDALEHYNRHGKTDGRFRCQAEMQDSLARQAAEAAALKYAFDTEWYLRVYPDVKAIGIDPQEHYRLYGEADGRFRCQAEMLDTLFDAEAYLKNYPEVAKIGLDPLSHYMEYGWSEGRLTGHLPLTLFDPDFYLRCNPDVADAGIGALRHFLLDAGRVQGRPYTSFAVLDAIEPEPLVYSSPLKNTQVKLIAFYLPQYHPIPENDRWWGKGFTEWKNVVRGKPYYQNHEQPRLPGELGFYDLRVADVMQRQAELARVHGIYGFCFYVYWFGGKRLLESPVEMLLRHPEIDINFCYCWANENWTRRWDGLDDDVLIGQAHSPEDDIGFIESIAPAFADKRYIRVEGKPMLLVYRPGLFPDIKATVGRWRDWCRDNEVGEIHVCFTAAFDSGNPLEMGMDAAVQFPPVSMPVQDISELIKKADSEFRGQVHNYLFSAKKAKHYVRPDWLEYRGVMPSWDNTARKMERSISFFGSTPELYAEWLDSAVAETKSALPAEQRFVFINAWNEWAEGAYLEPDQRRGYAYLSRTREVMARYSDPVVNQRQLLKKTKKTHDVAVIVHLYYGDLFEVIARYLENFSGNADLYFSVRDGAFNEMQAEIKSRFPDAIVLSYPNRGRDVLPFLHVFPHILKLNYQAVCKVHTKKSKHRQDGDHWRNDVFNKLFGDRQTISACLEQIKQGAGVVAPAGHLLEGSFYWGSNAQRVTELAVKMGCPEEWLAKFSFPAGTMFWFAPEALKPLLDLKLKAEDFEAEAGQVDGTTAHAVERLIGLTVMKSGFSIGISDGEAEDGRDYPFAEKS
ncbi:MAG: glycoside hydrolase family 99-like domain-containing protein [Methylococcales bacterium]|nr:glycoside hydrolase family 99-like domain-containing protein [Methylococcales bacterium]